MTKTPAYGGAALLLTLALATVAQAQSASTYTPDRRILLVNKDVGAERWTVSLNLTAPDDPARITSLTGNVYKSDGTPPNRAGSVSSSTRTMSESSSVIPAAVSFS